MHKYVRLYIHIYMHKCQQMCSFVCVCKYSCMFIYVCVYVYVNIYITRRGEAGGATRGSMHGALRPPVPHTCADWGLVGSQGVT